jgi:hypothetical protein
MEWARHVTPIGSGKLHTGFGGGNLMEREHLEDLRVDGRIILKWIVTE